MECSEANQLESTNVGTEIFNILKSQLKTIFKLFCWEKNILFLIVNIILKKASTR